MNEISSFPLIRSNFLNPGFCAQLVDFCEDSDKLFGELGQDFWAGRVINLDKIHNPNIEQILLDARQQMKSILAAHLPADEPLYAENLQLVRWLSGYQLEPHADKENPNDVPHPYPWRDYAAVIYINDNYKGGSIHFQFQQLEVKPTAGTLITFPGSLNYLHGVKEVTAGVRYTIACFFTNDERYGDNLDQRFGSKH